MKVFYNGLHRVVFFLILIHSLSISATECLQKRMGIDIGSGSTKIRLAEVDTCQKKIERMIFEKSLALAFKDDLARNSQKNFSEKMIKEALEKISEVIAELEAEKPFAIYAVATSAFRDARNARLLSHELSKKIGAPIKIIDQKKEGLLGFLGASSVTGIPENQLVVWDIGGGSQQLTMLENSRPKIFLGKLASASFKNEIIKKIQKKDILTTLSPNPINLFQGAMAINLVVNDAKKIPKVIREAMVSPQYKIVGIGGVHNNSLKDQIKFKDGLYTFEMLEKTIKERLGLTDSEIGGDYASTDISNLLFVYGIMGALNVKQVATAKVSLAEAVVLHPDVVGFK